MGADQSNSRRDERDKISKDEMERLLRQQKALFEQKYAELLRTAKAQHQAAANETAREEARKEVERIMKQKQEQLIKQNAQLSSTPVKTASVTPTQVSSNVLERDRSPYTCAGSALTSPTLAPAAAKTSIYPNLTNENAGRNTSMPDRSAPSTTGNVPSPSIVNTNSVTGTRNVPSPSPVNVGNGIPSTSNASKTFSNSNVQQPLFPSQSTASTATPFRNQPSAPSRERSISRNRNHGGNDEELNCPTCKSRFDGNIFQCSRGHSSCRHCKLGYRPCGVYVSRRAGICGLPITDMRNITLEAYIFERRVQCPNSDEGCCLYMKIAEMDAHVKECPFRELNCPLSSIFGQCSWSGKLSQVAGHFDNIHQMHRQGDVDTEMVLLNLTNNNHIVYLIVMGSYNFLFHAKVSTQDEKLYMTVQLLGTHHSAGKWNYEIHIYKKSQPRRKYQYSEICRSVNFSLEDLFKNNECAAIPLKYAQTFVSENGLLAYKFFIKKEEIDNQMNYPNNPPNHGRGGVRNRRYGRNIKNDYVIVNNPRTNNN